jgi:membrane-bound lytic murein transglycosylase B
MTGSRELTTAVFVAVLVCLSTTADAAQCGSTAAGFEAWKGEFAGEARAKGIGASTVAALTQANYASATIAADRGQRSFSLSLDQFLAKRGAAAIVARGRSLKQSQGALFASIQQRYGVPPGPLIAIWGMETGFGSQRGNQNMLSSIATLAYDCRRTEFFTEQLYATLHLIDRGALSPSTRGSMHGEVGQTQFMPKNILAYGTGNLDVRRQRAEFDGELPQSAWLAPRRGIPTGRGQFRGHRGVECGFCLSASDRADGPADRRRVCGSLTGRATATRPLLHLWNCGDAT